MYQQTEMQSGQTAIYAPRLAIEDVFNIEMIAEQMRSQYIHGKKFNSEVRGISAISLSQAVFSAKKMSTVWLNRSRSRAQLAKMDSRMLADIGISGSEADQESHKWFWQN